MTILNPLQMQNWSCYTKFDGLNGSFKAFVGNLIGQITFTKGLTKEGSRKHKIQERAIRYLQIIHDDNLSSIKEIHENVRIVKLRREIREIPLPVLKEVVEQQVQSVDDGISKMKDNKIDVTSDIEESEVTEPGSLTEEQFENRDEGEVATYLHKIIKGSVTGSALDLVSSVDENGFVAIQTLAEIFGRTASQIALIPHMFRWGQGETLAHDWTDYKLMLESSQYHKLHPSCDVFMVQSAMAGFTKYQHCEQLHDYVRVHCGEGPTWESFREHVDIFIGNIHKNAFQQLILEDKNGEITTTKSNFIISPKFLISSNPLRAIKKSCLNESKKNKKLKEVSQNEKLSPFSTKSEKSKSQKKGKTSRPVNKKGARQCAWCGDTSHKYWNCNTHGNGKWKNRQCNRCLGTGHPSEVCSNPRKEKK